MRNGLIKELRVAISRTGLSVHAVRGWKDATPTLVAEVPLPGTSPEQITLAFDQGISDARHRGSFTSIVLADEFARLFMVPPPSNASGMRDLQAAAAMRFKSLYEAQVHDWRIEAGWNPEQPFLACAMQKALLTGLSQVAAKRHVKLVEIAPHFVASWNRWHAKLKPGAWFGVAHDDVLTLAPASEGTITALRSISVPASEWTRETWLSEHVQREALRLNLPAPSLVQMCGDLPAGWIGRSIGGIAFQRLHGEDPTSRTAGLKLTQAGAR